MSRVTPAMRKALVRLSDGARRVQPSVYRGMEVWRTPGGSTLPRQTVHALAARRLASLRDDVAVLTPAGRRLASAT